MKRSPLRYRSKKTARAYIQRRQLVDRLLKERPFCDPDEAYRTACRYCHDKVGANPAESFARGFAIHSWEEIS